ncbi:Ig-like domain-containing protein [Aneurinibacillus uraniidurans]|uniref:Ig-like domain-containing protein n=1 Tax=Aneurinibacillus uraniidurans TaxID=2966586 RepID=UPI00234AB23A|nr:Ig-like domain-containing protein [Aneurinibacillus sp. B1]WCN37946.1 Ig-like domain-containing protein [Aneurinibacillus sp. B1]
MSTTIKKVLVATFLVASIMFYHFPNSVVFAATETAANLTELESKLSTAMHSRVATYSITYTGGALTQSNVKAIIDSINSQDDYLYFTTKQYQYSLAISGNTSNLNFTFSYWENLAQTNTVDQVVTETLAQIITPDMNDYQKEKAIHDWIVKRISYDTSMVQHSAYAGVVAPYKTVCQGYALLAYKMLNQVGIETKILEGTAGGQAHAWVALKLDGAWYHLDPTWDDPVPDVAGRVKYDYYNLTDSQIKVNHSWTKTYPAAVTMFDEVLAQKKISDPTRVADYEAIEQALGLQYLKSENTASNRTELAAQIQSMIVNKESSKTFRYTSGSTFVADLSAVVTGLNNITSYGYTKSDFARTTDKGDVLVTVTLTYNTPTPVESVNLSTNSLSLKVGGPTAAVTATVAPSNASNKNVIWTTSDASVATVAQGVVKAVGGGKATITATTVDGNKQAAIDVTVTAPVTGVTIDPKTLILKVGEEDRTLQATVAPVSATNKAVTWISSNPAVATVDENGKVHAVKPGAATITVKTVDGLKTASCTVTVPVVGTTMKLPETLTVKMKTTSTLTPVFTPVNTTNKAVTWVSSNPEIATVSEKGVITPKTPGSTTITATAVDGGFTASTNVTVIWAVTGIKLDKTALSLKVGEEDVALTATITPENATNQAITWTSSNPAIATVDENGKVHAIKPGTVVITAKTVEGLKVASCRVTVPVVGTTMKLPEALTVKMKTTSTLTPVFTPVNTTNKAVTWVSSNPEIATVSEKGVITPKTPGSTTITATAVDGGFTASTNVTVIWAVTGIKLDKTALSLKVGEEDAALTATITPENATNQAITWTSSNPKIATVDENGKVHAVGSGTAIITAKTVEGGKVATCRVSSSVPVAGISLGERATAKIGTALKLTPVFTPIAPTNKNIVWTSSDPAVAVVSTSGIITPKSTGTATITVKTVDGNFTASTEVTVIQGVTSVTLNQTTLTMTVGDAAVQLLPTVNPITATNQSVTWVSSNPSVVTVDENGTIQAVSAGTATITVKTVDGNKTAICRVTVKKA